MDYQKLPKISLETKEKVQVELLELEKLHSKTFQIR